MMVNILKYWAKTAGQPYEMSSARPTNKELIARAELAYLANLAYDKGYKQGVEDERGRFIKNLWYMDKKKMGRK